MSLGLEVLWWHVHFEVLQGLKMGQHEMKKRGSAKSISPQSLIMNKNYND